MKDGLINLGVCTVGPKSSPCEILDVVQGAKVIRSNKVSQEYYLGDFELGQLNVAVGTTFSGEILKSVGFEPAGINPWLEGYDIDATKELLDQWLLRDFGVTVPFTADWGRIEAVADRRSGFAHAMVSYGEHIW